jgi:hypothetical protein
MEGMFREFVIKELRELLADIEAGLLPSNIVLHERVTAELRKQYDFEQRYRGTP